MKKIVLMLLSGIYLQGQPSFPGGVSKPLLWEAGEENTSTGQVQLRPVRADIPLSLSPGCSSRSFYLNTHAACYAESSSSMEQQFPAGQLDKTTVFIVYQVSDTLKEKNIWAIKSARQTEQILTTHRLADYSQGKFINFLKGKQKTAEIQAYRNYLHDSLPQAKTLSIGGAADKKFPVDKFRGLIAEIIVYDRVLSPREQNQVESYLAVKYGIPLYQGGAVPQDYSNSLGETVWKGADNRKYPFRTAGVGRDINGNLNQKTGSSSLEAGIFSLEFTCPEEIPDQSYILWSDNGKELEIKKTRQGQPKGLAREWKLSSTLPALSFNLHMDAKASDGEIPSEDFWWLARDKSGTGDFPQGQTEYLKIGNTAEISEISVKELNLSESANGSEVLSLKIAPEMFAQAWITPPDCAGTQAGGISFKIEGGAPPFHLSLKSENYSRELLINTNKEISTVSYLKAGTYNCEVEDSRGSAYKETLHVESSDAPQSSLNSSYVLTDGSRLSLNAEIPQTNYSYQWTDGNGRVLSFDSRINIEQAGTYGLKITSGQGCSSFREIEVQGQSVNNFKGVDLFPNPSIGGEYYLRIVLLRSAPVQIGVYDFSGRLIAKELLKGGNYYLYQGKAPAQGAYYIQLQSENSKLTRKLLVR